MPFYYQFDEYGNEIEFEYQGNRLPSPGHYKYRGGKWWKLEKPQLSGDNYINVGDGVVSPIDGKLYTSGRAYADHAKQHDCVLVGNDFASKRAKRLETRAAKQAAKEKATKSNLATI